jgi:Contractile injection system tube protein
MPNGTPIPVHFNPSSLVYTVENSTQQQGSDPKRRQFAGQFTGKLSMDLQFDTTDTGVDVRQVTGQVALFMQSSASANKSSNGGANAPAPAVLSFEWGAYQFQGFMESFKETIDFFSADGIPLRALVSIGLARQDNVFDTGSANTPPPSGSLVPTSSSSSAASAAAQGGDPNAARALASANGLENPRFTGGAALEVGGGLQLNAAAGFAASASAGGGIGISGGLGVSLSAGAGVGISAGAGAGVSAGASAGASVGASAGVGVSAGVSVSTGAGGQVTLAAGGGALFGSTASAGVPATAGAFAGLETGRTTVSTTAQLDPMRMLPATVGSDVAAGANASFGLGGGATAPSGFSTDVGASFSFSDRLTFDGD